MSNFPMGPLGPCVVVWDPSGANITFEETFGGVTFKDEPFKKEVKQDQLGESVKDIIPMGRDVQLNVPLSDPDLTELEAVIPGATKGTNNLLVENIVGGTGYFAAAKEVIVKPIIGGVPTTDNKKWLHIFRAYPIASVEWPFAPEGQRVTNVTFQGFPDDASGQVGYFWRKGPAS